MPRNDSIGLRVARWRDIAGLTQQDLADRIGITAAYVSMIENGARAVTKRSLLIDLAKALGVSVTDLTGQPDSPRTKSELALYSAVPALRAALDDDPTDTSPIDPERLAVDVDRAMAARMACDYQTLVELMPATVAQTRQLANSGGDNERVGLALFVRTAVHTALTIKPFGYVDLAARLTERAAHAARLLGNPVETAAVQYAAAQVTLATGTPNARARSLRTCQQAAVDLGDTGDDDALTWYGMLHLHAALSAASLGRSGDVDTHLAEASAAAARVSGADRWRMEFGLPNVGIWRVGVALENGEPERAPVYARQVDRSQIRTVQRRARLHIDTGRGLYLADDPDGAVRQFLEADRLAAAELRARPAVREIVGQMVRDARGRGSSEMRELAVRLRIDPLADAGV